MFEVVLHKKYLYFYDFRIFIGIIKGVAEIKTFEMFKEENFSYLENSLRQGRWVGQRHEIFYTLIA